ncbi:S8 family serine peptidase [Flavobacterium lindanitolerans]|nr:S8 family serine peptidase [Flavobacterium lindanitolerans]
MKKITFLIVLLSGFWAVAQEDARVYFTDKPDAAHYMANPLEMLSQRALDRRTRQNIALDEKDVPISVSYINQVTASAGITVKAKSKWMNALHIRGTVEAIQNLENLTFVDHIQFANPTLNTAGRAMHQSQLANGNKNLETQVSFGYGTSANQIQMLKGNQLHQQDFTGNGKIIAVMDAGFPNVNTAQPFQRLITNNKILGGYDFVNRNTNFYTGGTHGTLVLATMGGYVENQLVGTGPDASYYLFITEDISDENPVEESYWVEAAEMADSLGVDIINTSLGYFIYNNPGYSYEYADMNGTTAFISRGADIAFSKGMICVVSAGNSGAGANPNISAPADAVNALAVGAVAPDSSYAGFSSIGPSFDGRVKPDIMAQGQQAVVSDTFGNIVTANGTSFSSPIISGMVACLWQAFPDKTNAEIIQLIKQSAHLYNTPNNQFGYGIPDFSRALANALDTPVFSENSFLVYPNPANSVVNLVIPESYEEVRIFIYNQLGQEIMNSKIKRENPVFSVENLQSGIYWYKIKAGNNYKTGKLAVK